MASGCEFEFLEYTGEELIDSNLKCAICHKPFQDPVCSPCDHTFGRGCIIRWLSESTDKTCPMCQKKSLSIKDLTPTGGPLRKMLDSLRVQCTLCGQTGLERGNFFDHINRFCPKAIIQCKAADIKCPWKGEREELQDHMSTCVFEPLRPVLALLITENRQLTEQVKKHGNEIKELRQKMSQLNNTAAANESDSDSGDSSVSGFSVGDAYQKEEDAIFIKNLPSTVKFNDLFDLFSKVGRIKYNTTTKKPKIFIFKNPYMDNGFCNAKVVFVDKASATAAVGEYNVRHIPQWNTCLHVSISTRKRQNFQTPGKVDKEEYVNMQNVASACAESKEPVVKGSKAIDSKQPTTDQNTNRSASHHRRGEKPKN